MSTEEVIKESFGEVVKGKEFDKNTEISSLGIDSLDLLESLMSMEEKLGIQFTDEEMLSFKTVGDVYTVIEKKLSK